MDARRFFFPILAIVALLTTALVLWGPAAAQDKEKAGKPAVKWEYKVIASGKGAAKLEEELNKLGDDGWDCAGIVNNVSGGGAGGPPTKTSTTLILKRPKQ